MPTSASTCTSTTSASCACGACCARWRRTRSRQPRADRAMSILQAFVQQMRHEADGIVSVELRPVDGGEFPPFDAGAHIDLHLPNGLIRNYSLVNPAGERGRYVIGVLRDRTSRGGSRYVHETLRVGQKLAISAP